MHNENETIYFGHDPIPNEIYEDYKQLEKLKREIEKIIENTKDINEKQKEAIKELLFSVHKNFKKMKPNIDQPKLQK